MPITVRFPPHLIRHFPMPAVCQAEGNTVSELLRDLERRFPGLAAYVVDEQWSLRQHVNIFLGEKLIRDRVKLSDAVTEQDEMFVMQALSGG